MRSIEAIRFKPCQFSSGLTTLHMQSNLSAELLDKTLVYKGISWLVELASPHTKLPKTNLCHVRRPVLHVTTLIACQHTYSVACHHTYCSPHSVFDVHVLISSLRLSLRLSFNLVSCLPLQRSQEGIEHGNTGWASFGFRLPFTGRHAEQQVCVFFRLEHWISITLLSTEQMCSALGGGHSNIIIQWAHLWVMVGSTPCCWHTGILWMTLRGLAMLCGGKQGMGGRGVGAGAEAGHGLQGGEAGAEPGHGLQGRGCVQRQGTNGRGGLRKGTRLHGVATFGVCSLSFVL